MRYFGCVEWRGPGNLGRLNEEFVVPLATSKVNKLVASLDDRVSGSDAFAAESFRIRLSSQTSNARSEMSGNGWLASGAVMAGLGVVFGAFAAHGMDKFVVEKNADLEAKTVAGQDFGIVEVPAGFQNRG